MPRGKIARVLVVDDTPEVRYTVQVVLETLGGWEVVTADDGQEGVEMAIADPPDLIVMDVQMPRMDGPTAFRKLQENTATRGIPVVFLTAKAQTGDLLPLVDMGARGILHKPFEPMFLATEIARILGVPLPVREGLT